MLLFHLQTRQDILKRIFIQFNLCSATCGSCIRKNHYINKHMQWRSLNGIISKNLERIALISLQKQGLHITLRKHAYIILTPLNPSFI